MNENKHKVNDHFGMTPGGNSQNLEFLNFFSILCKYTGSPCIWVKII